MADDHAVDEILSDVQFTAWRRLHDVPDDDSGAHRWLWRVAHNSILNHVRGKARRRRLSERLINQPVTTRAVYPAELDRVLSFDALDSLTAGDRQLVVWVLEGRTHHEMATALALTPGAVAMRLLRVRARLDHALS